MKSEKIKDWHSISIAKYRKIVEAMNDNNLTEIDRNVRLISIIEDLEEETVWDMPLDKIQVIMRDYEWIKHFDFDKTKKHKYVYINDEKYNLNLDINKMSVAQFVDFQSYWGKQDFVNNMGAVLSCFILPKGHKKYNDGYDPIEFIKQIENSVDIVTAQEVCFFFLKKLAISIQSLLLCLNWTMKAMETKKMTPEREKKIKELREKIAQTRQLLSHYIIG